MKLGIIGAGISGLSLGKILKSQYEIEVLEKESVPGGIARVKEINGIPYHTTGGHCLNSKKKEVMDFIFNEIMPREQWHQIIRNSKINFNGHLINYPIEFSIKEIAEFDMALALKMTKDFFCAPKTGDGPLDEWFANYFGNAIAHEYLIPYNKKIWDRDPTTMDSLWVRDKLPIPNDKDFFVGLIKNNRDTMPHSAFYYPNLNSQNYFIGALAKGLDITYSYNVKKIEKIGTKWIINGEKSFDKLVSTAPLKELPLMVENCPQEIIACSEKLKSNSVTTVFWKNEPVDSTWIYYPSKDIVFHRQINIGQFIKPAQNYCITEVIGKKNYEEVTNFNHKTLGLKAPLDFHVSGHAYVVFDKNHKSCTTAIKKYCDTIGISSLGRFGEWEYYNMDVCIEKALNLAQKLSVYS